MGGVAHDGILSNRIHPDAHFKSRMRARCRYLERDAEGLIPRLPSIRDASEWNRDATGCESDAYCIAMQVGNFRHQSKDAMGRHDAGP